jgi:hypothetical protein
MNEDFRVGSLTLWTIFVVAIIVVLTTLWAFVYWWKKAKYTRERFAFIGAVALISSVSLLALMLTSGTSAWSILINALPSVVKFLGLKEVFNLPDTLVQPSQLSPFGAIVFLLSILGLSRWFFRMFTHWEGQKSIAQHEQEVNQSRPSVGADIALLLSTKKERRTKLAPYQERFEPTADTFEAAIATVVWHEQARQLLIAKHSNYIFKDEYDIAHRCWWGEDKLTGVFVCLFCPLAPPSRDEVNIFLACTNGIALGRGKSIDRIVLASKDGNFEPYDEHYDGVKLQWTNHEALLNNLVDFSDYFHFLNYRVTRANLPDTQLTLSQTYSPSRYRLSLKESAGTDDLEEFLTTWLNESSTRHIALLGEYGQGKSTISLMLSHKLMATIKAGSSTARIPILLELRGKSPRSLTPEELLATWAYKYRIHVHSLIQLLIAGRLLLIFEGFDEIDLTGDTDSRLNHFRTLWRMAYPQAKILITGRPNFFLDDAERKISLGIENAHSTKPYCTAIYLAPFTITQIKDSLREVDAQTCGEICALASKDKKFLEIVARPSLLFIVSTLWKREKLSEHLNQISSAFVMNLFIRHSYRRQGAKEAERNFMALNTAERAYFMEGIAAYMGANMLPNQISARELTLAIDHLVSVIPEEVSKTAGVTEDETRVPLRSRFDWENSKAETLDHIRTDVRACGILVTDLSKDGTFKFAHKSFMEFLQASLVRGLISENYLLSVPARSICNSLGFRISAIENSSEAMMFLAEMLLTDLPKDVGSSKEETIAKKLFSVLVVGDLGKNSFLLKMTKWILGIFIYLANRFAKSYKLFDLIKFHALFRFTDLMVSLMLVILPLALLMTGLELATVVLQIPRIFDRGNMFSASGLSALAAIYSLLIVVFASSESARRSMMRLMPILLGKHDTEIQRGASYRFTKWFTICRNLGIAMPLMSKILGPHLALFLEQESIRTHQRAPTLDVESTN